MPRLLDVIEEKIAWFWNFRLPEALRRDLDLGSPTTPAMGNRVKVVVGVRRCGKTWRMYQEIARLESMGIDRHRILYFNFDDERLRPYDRLLPSQVMEAFYTLSPASREGAYLFFDEVQDVPDWGVFMRRMVDTENLTCYVTGSSSRMLSGEVATEFRGRATRFELTPYSFSEYARLHGRDGLVVTAGSPARTEQDRLDLARMLRTYLVEGGFPEAQGLEPTESIEMLQDIAANVVTADVVERNDFSSMRIARVVASQCLASSARKLSITKLSNRLKSAGMGMGWERLDSLVGYLEDANLMYRVPEYSTSASENSRKAQKVYANDQSLVLAVSPSTSVDRGLALETVVYLELRRRHSVGRKHEIMTFAIPSGGGTLEVDFVKGDRLFDTAVDLVQVCERMDDEKTRRREIRALERAMELAGQHEGTIVALSGSEEIESAAGTIRVVPAWQWLLSGE